MVTTARRFASASLAGLLTVRAPAHGVPAALVGVWAAGLLVAAAVPTDSGRRPAARRSARR